MNIRDISKILSKESELNTEEISALLMRFVEVAQENIYNGNEVKLQGLATFKIVISEPTTAYVPTAKKRIAIPKRFNFKVNKSIDFTKKINNKPIG